MKNLGFSVKNQAVWCLALALLAANCCSGASIYLPSTSQASRAEVISLNSGPHLFLDEFLIDSSSNITRRVNVPSRDPAIPNPLVTGREDGCSQASLYYGGYRCGHKVNRFEERQIGLVKMKRDRYVAREAGESGGSFRTPVVRLKTSAMTLNADAQSGVVQVQVLTADGRPIPGFIRTDCEPIRGDVLAAPVRWAQPLSALGDRFVRLEFFLENARLYAFELH